MKGLGTNVGVVSLHLEEGVAVAWPLVEGVLARDMSLRVPVARLEAVSVNTHPSDKEALQEAAVAATEATVKNFRDHQYRIAYCKGQLRSALLNGLKGLEKSFVQKVKLGLVNLEVDYELFHIQPPTSKSAVFEMKRNNLDNLDSLLGSCWDQLPLGRFVTRVVIKVTQGGFLHATISAAARPTVVGL